MKEKIRPIYRELQAYLAQAPRLIHNSDTTRDKTLWIQYNNLVDELNKITGEDWNRHKITGIGYIPGTKFSDPYENIYISEYRAKVNGLIERLYGTYFTDESVPFDGAPSTILTQYQSQSQTIDVQILLDLQSKIDTEIPKYKEGTPERSFLDKIKSGLSGIKNINELVSMILQNGKDIGLTIAQLLKLFS